MLIYQGPMVLVALFAAHREECKKKAGSSFSFHLAATLKAHDVALVDFAQHLNVLLQVGRGEGGGKGGGVSG